MTDKAKSRMKRLRQLSRYLELIYWKWYNHGELRMREWEELYDLEASLFKK